MSKKNHEEEEENPEVKRRKQREVALINLKDTVIVDIAVAHYVENGEYGKEINSTYEGAKYLPAMQEGSKPLQKAILRALLSSRQDKKRYTGTVSEYKIIQDCAKIVQESIDRVKVEDILNLIGSKKDVNPNYSDKYVFELANSENQIDKGVYEQIVADYHQYIIEKSVSEALGKKAKTIQGGLEKLLVEGPRKENVEQTA